MAGLGELTAVLNAGDRLAPFALACFVEHFARHPRQAIVYADEIRAAPDGESEPVFKPGWSPTLQQFSPYVGRAALFRAALIERPEELTARPPEALVDRLLAKAGAGAAGRIARPLFISPKEEARDAAPRAPAILSRATSTQVGVIVPTRDRADLLEPCLTTLLARGSHRRLSVVVVDNGGVEPRTRSLLARLQQSDARLEVLPAPGPFNFSALCNAGAAAVEGEYLVFLNNDTQIVTPDWIERLLHFAQSPDVGAVGAKLLYPNGSVQHAGVLLGMGGVAGHFGAGLAREAAGWLGRNRFPHEVSAVTGACLMVERKKFEAVGGFDAVNLPVELNDVDLCLRLAERGWRTICNPQVELLHRESASRGGGGLRLQRVHEQERRYFYERWSSILRDDPYFHPGLSLYDRAPALP
jgi:GT2 family glycosyltransferase